MYDLPIEKSFDSRGPDNWHSMILVMPGCGRCQSFVHFTVTFVHIMNMYILYHLQILNTL